MSSRLRGTDKFFEESVRILIGSGQNKEDSACLDSLPREVRLKAGLGLLEEREELACFLYRRASVLAARAGAFQFLAEKAGGSSPTQPVPLLSLASSAVAVYQHGLDHTESQGPAWSLFLRETLFWSLYRRKFLQRLQEKVSEDSSQRHWVERYLIELRELCLLQREPRILPLEIQDYPLFYSPGIAQKIVHSAHHERQKGYPSFKEILTTLYPSTEGS